MFTCSKFLSPSHEGYTGGNTSTVVSHLKGAVLLLQNYTDLPTDLIGLLHDILASAKNEDFVAFIKALYFNHKMKTTEVSYTMFLNHTRSEYIIMYRNKKWTASQTDPSSSLYVAPIDDNNSNRNAWSRGQGRQGRGGGHGGGRHGGRGYG